MDCGVRRALWIRYISEIWSFTATTVFIRKKPSGTEIPFDVTLYTNTRLAGLTDDLEKSINYGEISHQIKDYMSSHTYKLLKQQPRISAGSFFCRRKAWKRSIWRSRSPWAPVNLPLDTDFVEIERGWHTAYIAVGANMGETEKTVREAIQEVGTIKDTTVTRSLSLIVTKPYGVVWSRMISSTGPWRCGPFSRRKSFLRSSTA